MLNYQRAKSFNSQQTSHVTKDPIQIRRKTPGYFRYLGRCVSCSRHGGCRQEIAAWSKPFFGVYIFLRSLSCFFGGIKGLATPHMAVLTDGDTGSEREREKKREKKSCAVELY
jgi:hypothetical protein